MRPDDPRDQQVVAGAQALHRVLEEHRIAHGGIRAPPDHLHERLLHVSGKLLLQHFFERDAVFGLVGEGDGAEGAVAAGGDEGADGERVRAEAGFGGAVELGDVGVGVVGEDGGGVFLAGGGEDHGEEAGGFAGEVGGDGGGEGAVVGGLVGALDGVQIGVGAGEENVVQEGFVGADAFEGFVRVVDVLLEGAAQDGEEAELEVRGGFAADVGFERALVLLGVCLFEERDLEGALTGEDADQRRLVGAEAFYRFTEGRGFLGGIALRCLTGNITHGWWSRYHLRRSVRLLQSAVSCRIRRTRRRCPILTIVVLRRVLTRARLAVLLLLWSLWWIGLRRVALWRWLAISTLLWWISWWVILALRLGWTVALLLRVWRATLRWMLRRGSSLVTGLRRVCTVVSAKRTNKLKHRMLYTIEEVLRMAGEAPAVEDTPSLRF